MTITLIFIITKMWSVSIFLCSCSLIASIHPQQSTWISPKSSQRFSPITITKMRSLSTFLCPYSIITSNTLNMDIAKSCQKIFTIAIHQDEAVHISSSHVHVPSLPASYRQNHHKDFHHHHHQDEAFHHLLTSSFPRCQNQWLQSTSHGQHHLRPDSQAETLKSMARF